MGLDMKKKKFSAKKQDMPVTDNDATENFPVNNFHNKRPEQTSKMGERKARWAQMRAHRRRDIQEFYGISSNTEASEHLGLHAARLVIKKRWLILFLMTVVVAAGLCAYFYIDSLNRAEATMMLNYEESAKGLAPNNTRFNISNFTSEEMMERVIQSAGLEGTVSAHTLANHIEVYETISKMPYATESYYIPTSYHIFYKNPQKVKGLSAEEMLKIICDTYTAYFHENYTVNTQILSGDYDNLNNLEYAQIGSLFSLRINEIIRFLDMRSSEGGQFKSEVTGETFSSVKKLAENVRDYTLAEYNAYIWENGIVKEQTKYINTLMYLNDDYYSDKVEAMNEYDIRRETIGYFSTGMSTSILIPTTNKNEFYMARTKTGVDYLASDAEYFLETSKALELKIQKGLDRLGKIHGTAMPEQVEKANQMISNIQTELERIENLAVETNKEYAEGRSKNYITFQNDEFSFWDRIPARKVLLVSILFLMLAFFVYYKECREILKKGVAK